MRIGVDKGELFRCRERKKIISPEIEVERGNGQGVEVDGDIAAQNRPRRWAVAAPKGEIEPRADQGDMGQEIADLGDGADRPGLRDRRKTHRQQSTDHPRVIRQLRPQLPTGCQPGEQNEYRQIAQMQGQVIDEGNANDEVPIGEPAEFIDQHQGKQREPKSSMGPPIWRPPLHIGAAYSKERGHSDPEQVARRK